MIDLLFLAMWVAVTWVAGAATLGDPGPYDLSAWVRALWQQTMPTAWFVLPGITLVAAWMVLTQLAAVGNRWFGGHNMGPDGVLRDGAGHPISTFGPFTWRRRR